MDNIESTRALETRADCGKQVKRSGIAPEANPIEGAQDGRRRQRKAADKEPGSAGEPSQIRSGCARDIARAGEEIVILHFGLENPRPFTAARENFDFMSPADQSRHLVRKIRG